MTTTINNIIKQYGPLIDAINSQIKEKIAPLNPIFLEDDLSYTKKKHRFIKDNLDLNIPENDYFKFETTCSSLNSRVSIINNSLFNNDFNKNVQIKIDLILPDSGMNILEFDSLLLEYPLLDINKNLIVNLEIKKDSTKNLYLKYSLLHSVEKFRINFEKNITKSQEFFYFDNNNDIRYLSDYISELRTLFSLYQFEPDIVNQFLLLNKDLTNEQKETFKLLYDIDFNNNSFLITKSQSQEKIKNKF